VNIVTFKAWGEADFHLVPKMEGITAVDETVIFGLQVGSLDSVNMTISLVIRGAGHPETKVEFEDCFFPQNLPEGVIDLRSFSEDPSLDLLCAFKCGVETLITQKAELEIKADMGFEDGGIVEPNAERDILFTLQVGKFLTAARAKLKDVPQLIPHLTPQEAREYEGRDA
jgi:hypothetical protein